MLRSGCVLLLLCVSGEAQEAGKLREAATKSVALLQATGETWWKNQSCVSCHHQSLPMMTFRLARERGIALNVAQYRDTVTRTFSHLKSLDEAVQFPYIIDPALFDATTLIAAHDAGVPVTLATRVYARHIAGRQFQDGHWITSDMRPPQAHSTFTATAVALRTLQLQGVDAHRIPRAVDWLRAARPANTEDATFRVLGLAWGGASHADVKQASGDLLERQRDDGGWSQIPRLESDAYATGQALVALHEARVPVSDPAWRKGLRFLLNSQAPDGSWHVKTRLVEQHLLSPPYFETGFPYKKDQIASCMGTAWAAAALLLALEPTGTKPAPVVDASLVSPATEPWMETALFGSVDDVKSQLDSGVNPNSKTANGTTMLMMTAHDPAKVRLLLERGADVSARAKSRYTALMVAANHRGAAETVRLLLDKGAAVNAPPKLRPLFNASAMFFAVWSGNLEAAEMLRVKGADLKHKMMVLGRIPSTMVETALFQRDPAMLRYLVKHGADPNATDGQGLPPLVFAAISNDETMVRALVESGAKLDLRDKSGMTPLMHAALIDHGDTRMAQLLIELGADPSLRSRDGLTAADMAKKHNHLSYSVISAIRSGRSASHKQ
jgi:ankyrin repeat protein